MTLNISCKDPFSNDKIKAETSTAKRLFSFFFACVFLVCFIVLNWLMMSTPFILITSCKAGLFIYIKLYSRLMEYYSKPIHTPGHQNAHRVLCCFVLCIISFAHIWTSLLPTLCLFCKSFIGSLFLTMWVLCYHSSSEGRVTSDVGRK